jgi:hypothetical protein
VLDNAWTVFVDRGGVWVKGWQTVGVLILAAFAGCGGASSTSATGKLTAAESTTKAEIVRLVTTLERQSDEAAHVAPERWEAFWIRAPKDVSALSVPTSMDAARRGFVASLQGVLPAMHEKEHALEQRRDGPLVLQVEHHLRAVISRARAARLTLERAIASCRRANYSC